MLLKNPLVMVGTIERCWLFTYQTPVDDARALVPSELELVTRGDRAFWNMVICRLKAMRPKGFPAFAGFSYWHVAYRLYVRCYPRNGPPIEGIYFTRSDCDSRLMTGMGNLLTDYRFHTAGIRIVEEAPQLHIAVHSPDAPARITLDRATPPRLPDDSAFASLEEAAAFLKYQPFGISQDRRGRANIVAIERDESAWQSRLIHVSAAEWAFLAGKRLRPEICYEVAPIDYQWNRGRVVDLR
jgi:Uncharacterized conserved protein (COG2071)